MKTSIFCFTGETAEAKAKTTRNAIDNGQVIQTIEDDMGIFVKDPKTGKYYWDKQPEIAFNISTGKVTKRFVIGTSILGENKNQI